MSAHLQHFVDQFRVPCVITSFDSASPMILAANKAHASLTGYAFLEVAGKNPRMFQGPLTSKEATIDLKKELEACHFWHGCILNYKKDGTAYIIELTICGVMINRQPYYCAIKIPVDPIEI